MEPEELLRTLIDAELAARDASNARVRMKAAAFPVIKTIEEFDVTASSIPRATFDYLASLEWIRATENYRAVGPAGTGKSHSLIALGVAGRRVPMARLRRAQQPLELGVQRGHRTYRRRRPPTPGGSSPHVVADELRS